MKLKRPQSNISAHILSELDEKKDRGNLATPHHQSVEPGTYKTYRDDTYFDVGRSRTAYAEVDEPDILDADGDINKHYTN